MSVAVEANVCVSGASCLFHQPLAGFDPVIMTMGEKYGLSISFQYAGAAYSGGGEKITVSGNTNQCLMWEFDANTLKIIVSVAEMDNGICIRMCLDHVVQGTPSPMGIGNNKYLH